ncbi:MAG: putative ATPase of the ABC class [uncultured bacterium]|nr:MAG: putative ATPase of the ABC class [uncultured bacterium]
MLCEHLDGQAFSSYRKLLGKAYGHDLFRIAFVHIQGSPGAFPASVYHLRLSHAVLGLADWSPANGPRRLATADYLLRAFQAGVVRHARQNRGARGSGSFQPLPLPPQVLERKKHCPFSCNRGANRLSHQSAGIS